MDADSATRGAAGRRRPPGSAGGVPGDRIPAGVLAACRGVVEGLQDHTRISVAVTSVAGGEGRTLVAHGLARVLHGELGRPVIILAAQQDPAPAAGSAAPEQLLAGVAWIEDGLGVLTVGIDPPRGGASALTEVVAAVHGADYDVVADLPTLDTAGVGASLRLFSRPVLVVRAGTTRIDDVQHALSHMPGDPVVVLNRTTTAIPRILTRWLGT